MQKPVLKGDREPKSKQNHSRPGFVYLMFDPKVGLTKIGLSRVPKRRRYYLSREYQSELKLLVFAPTINMKFTDNDCFTEVKVSRSRHGDRTFLVESDSKVDAIDAVRVVHDTLPPLEPGESRNTKAYLGE